MHKQVSSLLSNSGSPGKLAQYTRILADQRVNVRSIGGAEWDGRGAVALLVDDGVDEDSLLEALNAGGFPSQVIYAAEAVLTDEPGRLAEACEAIGDLNIASILVADTHGGKGLVTFGFESAADAETALSRLDGLGGVKPHTLTAAWQAHEAWDATNPNQPPPDPANP
ncbi:MAG: hypothetical protein ACJ765_04375 [Chloroflexota bacterium]